MKEELLVVNANMRDEHLWELPFYKSCLCSA